MSGSRIPPQSSAIYQALKRALGPLWNQQVPPYEFQAVLPFMRNDVVPLQYPSPSYLILGSYRKPYIIRLREFSHELNKLPGHTSVVLGDTPSLNLQQLPESEIKLHLLAAAVDRVALVLEKDDGGEIYELGTITAVYQQRTYVLPRDFDGQDGKTPESPREVMAAAIKIDTDNSITDSQTKTEIQQMVADARSRGIQITLRSVADAIKRRRNANQLSNIPDYSWMAEGAFETYTRLNRCYPWVTVGQLRNDADKYVRIHPP